jgi:hypothetical protein
MLAIPAAPFFKTTLIKRKEADKHRVIQTVNPVSVKSDPTFPPKA